MIAELAGPWTLGWAFILALVTLLLALFTGWLAWTTRRLARATAEEVQGQTRPVVVPAENNVDVSEEQTGWANARGHIDVSVRLRNIGAGPALNFELSAGAGSYGGAIAALEPGKEEIGVVHIPVYDEGAHPFVSRTSRITVLYHDLAGRVFTTQFNWVVQGFGNRARINPFLQITSGVIPQEAPIVGPATYENPLMAAQGRRRPGRYQIREAWTRSVVQGPEEIPLPLRTRLHSAWRYLYPKRRTSRLQRMAWGVRVYRATLEKPIPYRLPRVLLRPYRIARGWKWAALTYFRMW